MNGKDLEVLEQKFKALKNEFKYRWDTHDKRSDEIWGEIRGDIKSICKELKTIASLKTSVNWLTWSVRGIIISLIGGFFWLIRK